MSSKIPETFEDKVWEVLFPTVGPAVARMIVEWHTIALEAAKREAENEDAVAELRWLKVYIKTRSLSPDALDAVLDYQIRGYEDGLSYPNQPKQEGGGDAS